MHHMNRRAHACLTALICCLACLALFGCADTTPQVDYGLETLTLTSIEQINPEELARYTALQTLDLRSLEISPAQADELLAALPDVSLLWQAPLGSARFDTASESLSLPADATDLSLLRFFPSLREVDATGYTNYDALLAAVKAFPTVAFRWTVDVCGKSMSNLDEMLDLDGVAGVDAAALERALAYLPNVKRVIATNTGLTSETEALAARFTDIEFVYDVLVSGEPFSTETVDLDLSGAASIDWDTLANELLKLPKLASVDLTEHEAGFEQMRTLQAACPNVAFRFLFTAFGRSVDADTTELDLRDQTFASPEELIETLAYLPSMQKVDLCGSGLSNEQMETLMSAYPNIKFVWMVKVGAWEMRTDITAFSKGNKRTFPNKMGRQTSSGKTNLYSEDLGPLKYCTDMVYLDLGHGNRISDLSILYSMPKLKVLILAINKITDITPIGSLTELEHLEIFMNGVTDLSPLTNCTKLINLNCCRNSISDVSSLYGIKTLKMLWIANNPDIPDEQVEQLKAELPDCKIITQASHSGDHGWRENELFQEYQDAFGLPATVW